LASLSFQQKLMLSFLLIIFIPMLAALLFLGFNFYNQTEKNFKDFMDQLNHRANVQIDNFVANIARNTYFYLTDSKLQTIMIRPTRTNEIEAFENLEAMQRAMDQVVLMNGNIAGITVLAPNKQMYASTQAYTWDLVPLIEEIGQERLGSGKIVVSSPYKSSRGNSQTKWISIIRYLSDVNRKDKMEGFIKVDIKFKAIEDLLGGLSDDQSEVNTILVDNEHVIYQSNSSLSDTESEQIALAVSGMPSDSDTSDKLLRKKINGKLHILTITKNDMTGWKIIQYTPTKVIDDAFLSNIRNYLIFSLLALIAAFLLTVFFSGYFVRPINLLRKGMKTGDSEQIVEQFGNRKDEIGQLIGSYNRMMIGLKESQERADASYQLQKKAEIKMLQAQINPHFLYNTLNTIHSISEINGIREISTIAKSLSSLYRYNIKSKDIVTLGTELEQMINYINIQQIRFLGKFEVQYDIPEQLHDYRIVKFLLQPIVENAFYHGLEPKDANGLLVISIWKEHGQLRISVRDNGVGMMEEKLAMINEMLSKPYPTEDTHVSNHFGLRSVQARIKSFYGEQYGIRICRLVPEGILVDMTIPAIKEVGME